MKKFISIIAIVLALLMAVSCGDTTTTNSNDNTVSNTASNTQQGGNVTADNSTLVQYPTYPDELPRDYDYEVSVTQGDKTINLPVYNAARHTNSYHNVKDTDSYRRFCEFAFEGEVTVSVKVKKAMTSYAILPSSRGIDSTFDNGVITFKMTKPENLLLRLNDEQNTILSILADPLEKDAPTEVTPNVVYFKAGLNNISMTAIDGFTVDAAGIYHIKSGYTVYLEPGALVTARLSIDNNATDVKITGRGAFLDSRLDRIKGDYSYMLYGYKVSNVTVENVKFLDAHCFNVCFTNVNNLTLKNMRILSSEISSDGISLWGNPPTTINDNILIDGCYLYCNDNVFVITSAEDLKVKDTVIGTRHGIFYPQGIVNDLQLEDIDIFRMGDFFRATEIMSSDVTWNIVGKNIRGEDALTTNSFIYMRTQLNGNKKILLENVSLPTITATPQNYASNTMNANFTCNNVFVNYGTKLNSRNILTESGMDNVNINFGSNFDEKAAGVGLYQKAVKKVSYAGDPTIKVGGYTLPFEAKGALDVEGYIPAENVLEAIYNKKDTTKFAKEVDGVRMISLDFLRNSHKLNVTVNDKGVTISAPDVTGVNLLKNGGFENVSHKLSLELQYSGLLNSRDWTCFDFGELRTDTKVFKSGKSSLRVTYTGETLDRGVAQYITPIIKTYGAGTYTFEAWVKKGTSDNAVNELKFGLTESGWQLGGKTMNLTTVPLTNEWTKITHTVKITDPNADGYDRAFFFVGQSLNNNNLDFYVDDAALYFSK